MAARLPLVLESGQIEQLPSGDYVNLGKLNLGPPVEVTAAATVPFSGSNMTLVNVGSTVNVDEISGGDEGDILVLRRSIGSDSVRIRKGVVNILGGSNRLLNGDTKVLILLRRSIDWLELSWNG